MRKRIISVINDVIRDAGAECLSCAKLNLDHPRHHEYQESEEHRAAELFEDPRPSLDIIPIPKINSSIPSILRYFLDGSRRTYKIADLIDRGHYLPLIAGQIGVGVLSRDIPTNQLRPERDFCSFEKVLAFPDQITGETDRLHLSQVIQRDAGQEFQSLGYAVKEDRDPVDLGIAKIMSHMADLELRAVHRLSEQQLLQNSMLLVKDGPLRYKNLGGRGFDITQFRNVIGLSKSFRPSFTVGTGRGKKDGNSSPPMKILRDKSLRFCYGRVDECRQGTQGVAKLGTIDCLAACLASSANPPTSPRPVCRARQTPKGIRRSPQDDNRT